MDQDNIDLNDDMDQQNVIDPPDRELEGIQVNHVTHFGFLHPPGDLNHVNGLHYTVNAGGRIIQVYIVEGEQGMMGQMSQNTMTFSDHGETFGTLVDQQHEELAKVQDHLVSAAVGMTDVFNISHSFLNLKS